MTSSTKFNSAELKTFAIRLLTTVGLPEDRASAVALTLLESDLMGHPTHGLALLGPYLQSLKNGGMTLLGEPEVIRDTGSTVTWEGKLLPGAWLVHKAIDLAIERIKQHPVMTVVIRRSHHIGCLAAYPERATKEGLIMILSCSDPAYNRVAPFGGVSGVYSPNPIAGGFPTEGDPIIFDISTSATAGGVIGQALKLEKPLPHPWLLDANGQPTDDPKSFLADPPSTILPLGGLDTGYKGFALGIMVDALTGALGGYGRADEPDTWMSSVFLQIIDPEVFGGLSAFKHEMQYFVNKSKAAATPKGAPPVRLPGERALHLRDTQLETGVELNPAIVAILENLSKEYQVALPSTV